jgi:uncharacterized membrane protein
LHDATDSATVRETLFRAGTGRQLTATTPPPTANDKTAVDIAISSTSITAGTKGRQRQELMMFDYWFSAPFYLSVSPISTYIILDFRSRSTSSHAREGWWLACTALFVGGLAAIVRNCDVLQSFRTAVQPSVTFSILCGIVQLMLVLNKSNIPRVMLCTACGVICAVLAIVPIFTPGPISVRCYQGCALPILFLFWQSSDCMPTTAIGDTSLPI